MLQLSQGYCLEDRCSYRTLWLCKVLGRSDVRTEADRRTRRAPPRRSTTRVTVIRRLYFGSAQIVDTREAAASANLKQAYHSVPVCFVPSAGANRATSVHYGLQQHVSWYVKTLGELQGWIA